MRNNEKEETALFYVGWALAVLCCCAWGLFHILPPSFFRLFPSCMIRRIWGIYCPGCGGTRAIAALLRGDFLTSFVCHPLVPYTAVVGGWFLASQTLERASRHRIKIGMHYRDGYVWAALAIVVANFLVKNLLLLWDIDLLKGITLY